MSAAIYYIAHMSESQLYINCKSIPGLPLSIVHFTQFFFLEKSCVIIKEKIKLLQIVNKNSKKVRFIY